MPLYTILMYSFLLLRKDTSVSEETPQVKQRTTLDSPTESTSWAAQQMPTTHTGLSTPFYKGENIKIHAEAFEIFFFSPTSIR